MNVRVQFFSQLKDAAGTAESNEEVAAGATIGDLLELLYQRHPRLRAWDQNLLFGAGVEFVDRDHVLQPDEEVAIMPPVQGG